MNETHKKALYKYTVLKVGTILQTQDIPAGGVCDTGDLVQVLAKAFTRHLGASNT